VIGLADKRSEVPQRVLSDEAAATRSLRLPAGALPVAPRRRFPFPPLGVGLVAIAMALMVSGYIVRVSGASGPSARLLSMDAPFSLPRMFVATLFAVAALAAIAGAGRLPGRRTWWLAVGLVAAGIATVKAGSTVHAVALQTLADAMTPVGALAVSALVLAAVVGTLWFLSRSERRDRRRVLGVLALYGAASVGLSAVSNVVWDRFGSASIWTAAATFVEETGEALAGVGFLIAVLIGVAPRLVLPRAWVLQREADAYALDLPEQLPGRPTIHDPSAG
jgi:hypothetical protein